MNPFINIEVLKLNQAPHNVIKRSRSETEYKLAPPKGDQTTPQTLELF
jgi:hypothetical protein